MFYNAEVFKTKKKEHYLGFFVLSIVISFIFGLLIYYFVIKIYKVSSLVDAKINKYYIVNILKKKYKVNDFILAKIYETNNVIIGKILFIGPGEIFINQNEIFFNNQKILLKNPLPAIINYQKSIILNEKEYFILSDFTIDSYYIGKIHHEDIIGTILFNF